MMLLCLQKNYLGALRLSCGMGSTACYRRAIRFRKPWCAARRGTYLLLCAPACSGITFDRDSQVSAMAPRIWRTANRAEARDACRRGSGNDLSVDSVSKVEVGRKPGARPWRWLCASDRYRLTWLFPCPGVQQDCRILFR